MMLLTGENLNAYYNLGSFTDDEDATTVLDGLTINQMNEMLGHVNDVIRTFYGMLAMSVGFDHEHARNDLKHALNVRRHIENYMLMGLL